MIANAAKIWRDIFNAVGEAYTTPPQTALESDLAALDAMTPVPMVGMLHAANKIFHHVTPTKNLGKLLNKGFSLMEYQKGITGRGERFGKRETEALGISLTKNRHLIDTYMKTAEEAPWAHQRTIKRLGPRSIVSTKVNLKDEEILDLTEETLSFKELLDKGYILGKEDDYGGFASILDDKLYDQLMEFEKGRIEDFSFPATLMPSVFYEEKLGMPRDYSVGSHPGKITKFLREKGYEAINYDDEIRVFNPENIEILGSTDRSDPLYEAWLNWKTTE